MAQRSSINCIVVKRWCRPRWGLPRRWWRSISYTHQFRGSYFSYFIQDFCLWRESLRCVGSCRDSESAQQFRKNVYFSSKLAIISSTLSRYGILLIFYSLRRNYTERIRKNDKDALPPSTHSSVSNDYLEKRTDRQCTMNSLSAVDTKNLRMN